MYFKLTGLSIVLFLFFGLGFIFTISVLGAVYTLFSTKNVNLLCVFYALFNSLQCTLYLS